MTFVYGGTTITFQGALFPVDLSYQSFQQFGVSTAGDTKVRNSNSMERLIKIVVKEPHSKHAAIVDFIRTTLVFSKTKFEFTPDSKVDAGNGDGQVIYARYWADNFSEIAQAWATYQYEIILRVFPGTVA